MALATEEQRKVLSGILRELFLGRVKLAGMIAGCQKLLKELEDLDSTINEILNGDGGT